MTKINLNQAPYFDDYTEGKKFYQILFRPGRAVQARELNQLQTNIKSQIDKLGTHIFENGTRVLPSGAQNDAIKYTNNLFFIKLTSSNSIFTDTEENLNTYWNGKIIASTTNPVGIRAKVIGYRGTDELGQVRLYLTYLNADNTIGTGLSFSPNQTISTEENGSIVANIVNDSTAVGTASAATVEEGVYFYNGRFILVDQQTIFLTPSSLNITTPSAWNNRPTASAGLVFKESVISWSDDESLLDNATGSPNIGAPGADRLFIDAELIQLDINSTNSVEDYVELLKVVSGDVQLKLISTEYSVIEDYLASRTFDESGDYTVRPFQIQIKEFLREDNNNGAHVEEEFLFDTLAEAKQISVTTFGLTGFYDISGNPGSAVLHPTITGKYVPGTSYNDINDSTSFRSLVEERLSAVLDPGKAYVKGYPVEKNSTTIVDFKKARTTKFVNNRFISTPLGDFIYVKNMYGSLDLNSYDTIDLYDKPITSNGSTPSAGNKIGTARVLAIEFYSGYFDPNSSTDTRIYRMFLFGIKMLNDISFDKVKSAYSSNPTFTCDVQLEKYPLTGSVSKPSIPFQLTGDYSTGSNIITNLSSTQNIRIGMSILGYTSNVVTVTEILTGTSIKVSANAGSTSTSQTFTFFPSGSTTFKILTGDTSSGNNTITDISSTSDLRVGMVVNGSGIPLNARITSISTNSIELSVNATATANNASLTFVDLNCLIGAGTIWRNDESERLIAGDYVEVNSNSSDSKIYVVSENPPSDTILRISSSASSDSWLDGSSINYLYTLLRSDSETSGLIYKLPDSPVSTIRGSTIGGIPDPTSIDTVYTIRRSDSGKQASLVSGSLYKITINADTDTEFEDFNTSSYSVIITQHPTSSKAGQWLQILPYQSGTPSERTAYVQTLGTSLNIFLNAADAISGATLAQFQINSCIVKPGGNVSKERPKQLVKGAFVGGSYTGGGSVVSTGADVNVISLGVPDVLRITRVVEGPAGFTAAPSSLETLPSGHKDVTGLYILDNGQRDTHYDIASVYLRPGSPRPRGQIRVEFDYFTHTGSGDYFSVNSYPFVGGVISGTQNMTYAEIPDFTSSDGTTYELSSCLDFRPVVGANGFDADFNISMGIPKENLRCDYHFYEGRRDKLFVDKFGKFLMKTGTPDANPVFPEDPDGGMVLYELDIAPYTYSTENVFPKFRENKRYTMRDIGKLENRISNLEYYTTLSLLEKDTNSLEIKDSLGNDRFKNGFIVDNFTSFYTSDLGSLDYRCSLDRTNGILRPLIYEDAIGLVEKSSLTINPENSRSASGYQKTGDLFTLPYTNVSMIEQIKASRAVNVNPYAVFVFVGKVNIDPWTDEWRETVDAEPLNILDQSAWEAARQSFGPSGTRIDYQTTSQHWTGTETTSEKTGGQGFEVAGHELLNRFGLSARAKRRARKEGFVKVPDGFGANSGKVIPVGRRNWISEEYRTTTTITGKEITTQFTSTFVDQGFSAPISLGSRIIDTSLIEYIRTKDISFSGKGFMPKAIVYPFFDGQSVAAYCKPIDGNNFGETLKTDGKGRIKGVFRIPDPKILSNPKFRTGERVFRLTTDQNNLQSPQPISAGEATYVARGWLDTKQETTYSTRLFTTTSGTTTSETDISLVTSSTLDFKNASPQDPIAQSFYVYERGGCFITAIDIFFKKRPVGEDQPPITLEVRTLGDESLPTRKILPFGVVTKEAVEVITNEINTSNNTITVTGYTPGSDQQIDNFQTENPDYYNSITGPWLNGEYNNTDANKIVSGVPKEYTLNPNTLMVPTRFTFDSPIYLAQDESYSFVLIANGIEYEVWVAQSGQDTSITDPEEQVFNVEIGTDIPIDKDPYIQGVFFKSQNGLTWTPDQTIDIKFKIWKADFNTAISGEIDFVNTQIPLKNLTLDPFEFSNGSSYMRITHPNHGHTTERVGGAVGDASKVVFSPEYDLLLSGTLTSTTNTVTISGGNFSELVVGSIIKSPINGEQRRVETIALPSTLTINSPFVVDLNSTSGVLATTYALPSGSTLGGIHADVIFNFKGFDVEYTELDYYRVDLNTNATLSGRFGGSKIYATENKRFDELTLITTPLSMPETSITWNVETTAGCGVNDSTTSTYLVNPRITFSPNQTVFFNNPCLIGSYINEVSDNGGAAESLSGPSTRNVPEAIDRKSISARAVLRSSNSNISPVLDKSRMTAQLVSNRLDNPRGLLTDGVEEAQVINGSFDDYVINSSTTSPTVTTTANKLYFLAGSTTLTGTATGVAGLRKISGTNTKFLSELLIGDIIRTSQNEERVVETIVSDTEILVSENLATGFTSPQSLYVKPQNLKIKCADANLSKHLSNLDVGKYLTIAGTASSTRNFSDKLILGVTYTPNNITVDSDLSAPKLIEILVDFRPTFSSGIDSGTISITQKDRFVDEISPLSGSVGSKYVSKRLSVNRPSNGLKVLFDASRHQTCDIELYYKLETINSTKSWDNTNWTKAEFNIDLGDGNFINSIPNANESILTFSEYQSTINNLPAFKSAQVKIVMRGGNPARSPRIKNFRMIILDE